MKTVAIFSGGMDSATLVKKLIDAGDEVLCLTVDYGQRHRKEILAAKSICELWRLTHKVVDLSSIASLMPNNSQTGGIAVPHGHYAEENMKKTVVPNRNMVMLAVAAAWAINEKADRIAYGAHSGDHTIYPDCRPEFVDALSAAIGLADWHKIDIYAPFLSIDKGEIAKLGLMIGVPFEMTWTCYEGLDEPCLKCGACQERTEAFEFAEK